MSEGTDGSMEMASLMLDAKLPVKGVTHAMHVGESDLPFVDIGDGSSIQLLHVDLTQGLWVVRTRFKPDYKVDTHYHTGTVMAITLEGSWYYAEYPETLNTKGSYLFEPAHSVHTLIVSEEADVFFAINGANINMDKDGNILSVVDASFILNSYRMLCSMQGLSTEKLIVIGG